MFTTNMSNCVLTAYVLSSLHRSKSDTVSHVFRSCDSLKLHCVSPAMSWFNLFHLKDEVGVGVV